MAVSFVYYRKAFMEDLLALFEGLGGVPVVGNECQPKVLGESSSNIVLDDVVAVEVNTGEVGLSIFEACNNKVIVVRILIVTLLVAEFSQVVGVILH